MVFRWFAATVRVLSFGLFRFWLSARRAATHRGDVVAVVAAVAAGDEADGDGDGDGGDGS